MAVGLLGIWIGGLAILLSAYFYTRAMFASQHAGAERPHDGATKRRGQERGGGGAKRGAGPRAPPDGTIPSSSRQPPTTSSCRSNSSRG